MLTVHVARVLVNGPAPVQLYPALVADVTPVKVALVFEQVMLPLAVAVTVGTVESVVTATVAETEQPPFRLRTVTVYVPGIPMPVGF